MRQLYLQRIRTAMKLALICFVIFFTIIICIATPQVEILNQGFDLITATVISIGFGASFGMVHISNKNM